MENILNKYDDNIISCQYESYIPQYTSELNKPNRNTTIIIDGKDKFLNIKKSKIHISFNCLQEDGSNYPEKSNVKISDNGGAFMFQKILVKLGNKILDEIEFVGRASTIKGYMSYAIDENGTTENSGFLSCFEGGGKGELIIPLSSFALGSMKDIKNPLYNTRFELIFTRNTDDDVLFLTKNTQATQDIKAKSGKIIILELKVLVPTIEYDEFSKIQIVNELMKLSQQKNLILAFKKWQCIEVRNITGKNIKLDLTNNYRNNNPPLFGAFCFQKNKLDNQSSNATNFDHCSVANYSFEINGKKYPKEMQNLDFADLKYCQAYEDSMEYKLTYYKSHEEHPSIYLSKSDFKNNKTFFVVNLTRQQDSVVPNSKVILNVEFGQTLSDNTICYVLLISRAVFMYDIERGIIDEMI